MNNSLAKSLRLLSLLLLCALPRMAHAAPLKPKGATNSVASAEDFHSTFITPKTPKDGRDPFYPNATSFYTVAKPTAADAQTTAAGALKLRGLSMSNYANINGITVGVGETQEIKTSSGPVSVHLIEIKAQDNSVIIEVNGQRRELSMGR